MDRNLESYVKVYDGWLDANKCDQTISEMNTAEWHQHVFYNAQTGQYTNQSGNKELDVSWSDNISTKPYIISSFILKDFK